MTNGDRAFFPALIDTDGEVPTTPSTTAAATGAGGPSASKLAQAVRNALSDASLRLTGGELDLSRQSVQFIDTRAEVVFEEERSRLKSRTRNATGRTGGGQ